MVTPDIRARVGMTTKPQQGDILNMKADFVNPLVSGVYEVFCSMLDAKVRYTHVALADTDKPPNQLMAVVGLSGAVRGTVAMLFTPETTHAILGKLLGDRAESAPSPEIVCDAMAEIVNMVSGFAKAKLSALVGSTLELTLPTVIRGEEYHVYAPAKSQWIEIQFASDLGPFSLRVCFEHVPNP